VSATIATHRVVMRPTGEGTSEGELVRGELVVTVRARRGIGALDVSLWDCGTFLVGVGHLIAEGECYRGRVAEFAGWWDVSGPRHGGELVFSEVAG
jgi:hypothetical protein